MHTDLHMTHPHLYILTAGWPDDLDVATMFSKIPRKRRSGLPLGHMQGPFNTEAAIACALVDLQTTTQSYNNNETLQATIATRDAQLRTMMSLLDQVNVGMSWVLPHCVPSQYHWDSAICSRLGEHEQAMRMANNSILRSQQHAAIYEARAKAAEAEVRRLQAALKSLHTQVDQQLSVHHRAAQAAKAETTIANAKLQLFLTAFGLVGQPASDNQHISQVWIMLQLIYEHSQHHCAQLHEAKSQDDSPRPAGLPEHIRSLLQPALPH